MPNFVQMLFYVHRDQKEVQTTVDVTKWLRLYLVTGDKKNQITDIIIISFIVEPCIDKSIISSNQLMHILLKTH